MYIFPNLLDDLCARIKETYSSNQALLAQLGPNERNLLLAQPAFAVDVSSFVQISARVKMMTLPELIEKKESLMGTLADLQHQRKVLIKMINIVKRPYDPKKYDSSRKNTHRTNSVCNTVRVSSSERSSKRILIHM